MSNCFPKWFYHVIRLPATCGDCRSTSSPILGVVGCGDFRHYDGRGVVSHCGLVCISLMMSDAEHLFTGCLTSIIFDEVSVQTIACFLLGICLIVAFGECFVYTEYNSL